MEQVRRLNENADRIAELLASATPEYEESVLKEMFRMHVDLTGQEISERLAGNYEKIYRHSGISSGRLLPWRIILPAD